MYEVIPRTTEPILSILLEATLFLTDKSYISRGILYSEKGSC